VKVKFEEEGGEDAPISGRALEPPCESGRMVKKILRGPRGELLKAKSASPAIRL